MEENRVNKVTYKFERQATFTDGSVYTDIKMFTDEDQMHQWMDILNNFTLWLGSIYGYDITKKIKVNGQPLGDHDETTYHFPDWPEVSEDFDPRSNLDNHEGCEDCGDSLGSRQDRSGASL